MARVVHFEIHADEPERAADFYRRVFQWEITKWAGPIEYWLVKTGPSEQPGINGGIMKRPVPAGSGGMTSYVCTIDVASVDESVKKATEAGGSVALPKQAIPGVGWLAYCKDTEGNVFGMMQQEASAR